MRRQFDLDFKKRVVASAAKLRKNGNRGTIKMFLKVIGINSSQLYYWENQAAQGLLKKKYAVAFSRNPDRLIKGKVALK